MLIRANREDTSTKLYSNMDMIIYLKEKIKQLEDENKDI